MARIGAGIVVYRPDWNQLKQLVAVSSRCTEWLGLFLNSPLTRDQIEELSREAKGSLRIMGEGANRGLGFAYNHILALARAEALDRLILFDQDSLPDPDLVDKLDGAMSELRLGGERPAVVGPLVIDAAGQEHKRPRTFPYPGGKQSSRSIPVEFVISSGSLLDLSVLEKVGLFREDFFIDAIDIEWCCRAWSAQHSCWMIEGARMTHRLGAGIVKVPGLGLTLVRQQPSRIYTYVRNQVFMLRLKHVPLRWKLRIVPYISLQALVYTVISRGDIRFITAIFEGFSDGLRGRLGKPGSRVTE